jgi:outer membrane protein assembly factor BamB
MYFTSDTISYAIDGATCAEKWKSVRHSATPSYLGVNRGFAYMDGRLFRGTSDVHVIALDARDGHVLWDKALEVQGVGMSEPMAPYASNLTFDARRQATSLEVLCKSVEHGRT